MTLTAEHEQTLARFPQALRQLVLDELAAGNGIEEIGHSFPAPPAGAYIKLSNFVSTRARAAGNGLTFRERNSAISAGEYSDDDRMYFVMEPPSPPQPEPDMDAIRREHQSPEDAARERLHQRPSARAAHLAATPRESGEVTQSYSPSGASYELHFGDARPPQDVQFALEGAARVLFVQTLENGRLWMRARVRVNGATYALTLAFDAAGANTNSYTLRIDVSWQVDQTEKNDYFRRSSRSWFDFWTRELVAAPAAPADEHIDARYRELCDTAMRAEANLDSVEALQQAVVDGVKAGGVYLQSHKEGSTEIAWKRGAFIRTDEGDYPATEIYPDETTFLTRLRQFCQWDIIGYGPDDVVSELDAWRLILRRMYVR